LLGSGRGAEGETEDVPVVRRHGLHARTDADLDHPRRDGIRDIHTRLQAAAALAIQAPHGRGVGEPSREGGGAELGGAAAGRQHGADGDVLHELGVDARARDQGLERADDEVRGGRVLEAALAALGEGRAQRRRDDDVVGVLLEELGQARGLQVAGDLGGSGLCCEGR